MNETLSDDVALILMVEYEDEADLEQDDRGRITNHDELVNAGKTRDVILAVDPGAANAVGGTRITPGHQHWREEFEDAEIGDRWEVSDS